MKPLISVIMPCFNSGEYIGAALESLLSQNYEPLEIIVVDDGSTDNSVSVIQSFGDKIKYYYQPNGGPAKARNLGLKNAKGDYIGFLDADDTMTENMLDKCMSIFEEQPSLEIVWGKYQIIYEKDAPRLNIPVMEDNTAFTTYLGTCLYRKEVFDKVGLLDEALRFGEDTDWLLRAKEAKLNMQKIDFVGIFYRRHHGNSTLDPECQSPKSLLNLLHRSIKRKRIDKESPAG